MSFNDVFVVVIYLVTAALMFAVGYSGGKIDGRKEGVSEYQGMIEKMMKLASITEEDDKDDRK